MMTTNPKTFGAFVARSAGRVLIDRNFALLWIGQGISLLGDFMFNTTLVLWVANGIARNQTWAPLAVSVAVLAGSLPGLLVGPFVGVYVDRWEKRDALLWLNAIQAVLMLVLIFVTGIAPLFWSPQTYPEGIGELIALVVVVLGVSICNQFFLRSIIALLPDLVGQTHRAQAMGLMQALVSCGLLVGPALGAMLYFAVGVNWTLIFDAVSFLVSWLTIAAIHVPLSARTGADATNATSCAGRSANPQQQAPRPVRSYGREFREGLRFFGASRVLMTLLIAALFVAPTEGAISVLNVFFLTQNLHASLAAYGLFGTALGAGIGIGAALGGALAKYIGTKRLFWLPMMLTGVLFLVYGHVTSLALALVILFLFALGGSASNVAYGPLFLQVTPKPLIGRVASIHDPALSLSRLVATAAVGALTSSLLHGLHTTVLGYSFNAISLVFTGTGFLALLGGLCGWYGLCAVDALDERTR